MSWRNTAESCGWAPLPPEALWLPGEGFSYLGRKVAFDFNFGLGFWDYSFIPVADLGEPCYDPFFISASLGRSIFQNSRPRAGVSLVDGNLTDAGLTLDFINAHARHHLKDVALHEAILAPGSPLRGEYSANDEFFLYRPRIAGTARFTPEAAMARQRERIARIDTRDEIRRVRDELIQRRPAAVLEAGDAANQRHTLALAAAQALRLPERAEARLNGRTEELQLTAAQRRARAQVSATREQAARVRVSAGELSREAFQRADVKQREELLAVAEKERAAAIGAHETGVVERRAADAAAKAYAERAQARAREIVRQPQPVTARPEQGERSRQGRLPEQQRLDAEARRHQEDLQRKESSPRPQEEERSHLPGGQQQAAESRQGLELQQAEEAAAQQEAEQFAQGASREQEGLLQAERTVRSQVRQENEYIQPGLWDWMRHKADVRQGQQQWLQTPVREQQIRENQKIQQQQEWINSPARGGY